MKPTFILKRESQKKQILKTHKQTKRNHSLTIYTLFLKQVDESQL